MTSFLDYSLDLQDAENVSLFDETTLWSAMFGLMLFEQMPFRKNEKILDVGFGTGFPLVDLAQRVGSTCSVVGIDPWAPAVERARKKAEYQNARNVSMVLGSAERMPFPDAEFDLIVSNLGLNNFQNPQAAMRECRRVSKPGSRLVLTTNLSGHMTEFYDLFLKLASEHGLPSLCADIQADVARRSTIESLTSLLEDNNYRVVRVHREERKIRFSDGAAFFNHYFVRASFIGSWKKIVFDHMGVDEGRQFFARLERRLNKIAEQDDVLSMTIPMAYLEAELRKESRSV